MKIAVCIPVRGALPHLKKTLEGLYNCNPPKFSLLMCDDNSDQVTHDYILEEVKPARAIIHKHQQWFTRSANDLLIMSFLGGADYIFLINSDLIIGAKGWMQDYISYLEEDEKGMLIGSEHTGSKSNKPNVVKSPGYVTGHCWLIKRECLTKVGILDERHMHIYSDVEFCHRICYKGYRCYSEHHRYIGHKAGASWGHDLSKITRHTSFLTQPRPVEMLNDERQVSLLKKKLKGVLE